MPFKVSTIVFFASSRFNLCLHINPLSQVPHPQSGESPGLLVVVDRGQSLGTGQLPSEKSPSPDMRSGCPCEWMWSSGGRASADVSMDH